MTEDREKLIELLREAERLADRLKEGVAAYQIRMAFVELLQIRGPIPSVAIERAKKLCDTLKCETAETLSLDQIEEMQSSLQNLRSLVPQLLDDTDIAIRALSGVPKKARFVQPNLLPDRERAYERALDAVSRIVARLMKPSA
jgi:DNA-binding Xre family transcriptional regulator